MHVPVTLALFATILVVLVALRLRWRRIPGRIRLLLIALSFAAVAAQGLSFVTRWRIAEDTPRVALYWAAIAGYEFFIVMLTLLRPRWLTTIIAVVLILPLLSASIFLPLGDLFNRNQQRIVPLDASLSGKITPWNSVLRSTSGVDVDIVESSRHVPFVDRALASARLYNNQCNTSAIVATLQPGRKSVLVSCPAWQAHPAGEDNVLLKLP